MYFRDMTIWIGAKNLVERTGHRQEYNMSSDVAKDKYDVFASFGYLKEQRDILSVLILNVSPLV